MIDKQKLCKCPNCKSNDWAKNGTKTNKSGILRYLMNCRICKKCFTFDESNNICFRIRHIDAFRPNCDICHRGMKKRVTENGVFKYSKRYMCFWCNTFKSVSIEKQTMRLIIKPFSQKEIRQVHAYLVKDKSLNYMSKKLGRTSYSIKKLIEFHKKEISKLDCKSKEIFTPIQPNSWFRL